MTVPDDVRPQNLTIHQGDDRGITWPVRDRDGDPIDLTDWSVRAQVRSRVDGVLLHEWSTANGRAALAHGAVTLKVDDSRDWTWQVGRYDLHLTDAAGRTEVLARGVVTVIPAVTRAGR